MLTPDDPGPFFHGTKARLVPGDLVTPGQRSNYGSRRPARFVYFSATMDAAIWGAELAEGGEPGRIYRIQPTGPWEDDPNLTNRRFPGNPTRSYRSAEPLLVLGLVSGWQGHPPQALADMRAHLDRLRAAGIEAIEE